MAYKVVQAAYGRQLLTQKAVREYYHTNKDFQILDIQDSGRYINKSDCERYGVKLQVRYGKQGEKVMVI